MKRQKKSTLSWCGIYLLLFIVASSFASCNPEEKPFVLSKEEIRIDKTDQELSSKVGEAFTIKVTAPEVAGISYEWLLDGEVISNMKDLDYTFAKAGTFDLKLTVKYDEVALTYEWTVTVSFADVTIEPTDKATAYITKVFDYVPGAGQFVNKLPEYEEGDTQEDMNRKVLEYIGNNNRAMVSLGGYGGYVVVGFDHTIENKPGLRDIMLHGNAFYAATKLEHLGGSVEPGIIMVAYDVNKNGIPDDDEWYEIAGSAHHDHTKETWYEYAKKRGNDVNCYLYDYEITYFKPESEPDRKDADAMRKYIRWEDNKGNKGYVEKNGFHHQPYYPLWVKEDKLTFKGTRLPQNGLNEAGPDKPNTTKYYVLYKFDYGYVDNTLNTDEKGSSIDIDWAVNSKGQPVKLPGVDFVKIYTGVLQVNDWLGENSTEVMNVIDLHVLGKEIASK